MEKPVRIVQCSYQRTGSTVLINILNGLLCPDEAINIHVDFTQDKLVTKNHNVDVVGFWEKQYAEDYDLYFIMSERGQRYKPELYKKPNVLIFQYAELLETPENGLPQIVANVNRRIRALLPASAFPSDDDAALEAKAVERIENMNAFYETIKSKPFSFYDEFYSIHGHHRGRGRK